MEFGPNADAVPMPCDDDDDDDDDAAAADRLTWRRRMVHPQFTPRSAVADAT